MSSNALLFTPGGKLRALWRILFFVVVLFVAVAVMITLESAIDTAALGAGYKPLVSEWGFPLGIVVATAVSLKWVDGLSWDFVKLDASAARPTLLAGSALLGALAIGIPSLLLIATGELRTVASAPGSWTAAAGLTFANLLPAAIGEELLLRGYVFAVLRES
ncbi:MAG: hypothetical protein ABI875_06515, partial [Gemmatimonadales bacterium]